MYAAERLESLFLQGGGMCRSHNQHARGHSERAAEVHGETLHVHSAHTLAVLHELVFEQSVSLNSIEDKAGPMQAHLTYGQTQ